jgi:hypothetical protein
VPKAYNKKVKPKVFKEGSLMLKKDLANIIRRSE